MARDGRIRRLKLRGGVRYPVDEILRIEHGDGRQPPARAGREAGAAYTVAAPPPVALAPAAAELWPSLPQVAERTWYTLCIAHRKGGVAKSTTTWFLARELAKAGQRVLLRDLDPQQGLRDILRDHGCEDGRYSRTIALVTDGDPLPFTPDVELIDTPPALDDSLPGVARSDAVIVPAMPEHQAVRALERMLHVLDQTRSEHPFTRVLGILPVRVKSRWAEHTAFLRQIVILGERFGHPVLPAIPESRAVLTYSLRGRLWRPAADSVLADLKRHRRIQANTDVNGSGA
jgi:cellulose biosynthesis protein BcsQ